MHCSLLCSWNDSNEFHFVIPALLIIVYLMVRWLAKNIYFFFLQIFPCLPFTLNLICKDINTVEGGEVGREN